MRRIRIAIIGPSPCGDCYAACCKQNGHTFAVLLRGDVETRKFAAFSIDATMRDEAGRLVTESVLPYVHGRCQFLGDDDRCTIYEDRPGACRAFECAPMFNARGIGLHGDFLERNTRVQELLERLAPEPTRA